MQILENNKREKERRRKGERERKKTIVSTRKYNEKYKIVSDRSSRTSKQIMSTGLFFIKYI